MPKSVYKLRVNKADLPLAVQEYLHLTADGIIGDTTWDEFITFPEVKPDENANMHVATVEVPDRAQKVKLSSKYIKRIALEQLKHFE